MCFGGGGGNKYDAYASGDFDKWKGVADARQKFLESGKGGRFKNNDEYWALSGRLKADPSANMEMREVNRQGDVSMGRKKIDKQFGRFNSGYYDKYQGAYRDFYTPELARQHDQAHDQLTANLADRGILESSVGASKYGDLERENATAQGNIANEANDATKKLKGTVENAKTNLYNLNQASANPQAVNAQAVGQATALVAPPTYSPLGRVFSDFLNGLTTFGDARSGNTAKRYSSPFTQPSGYGSASVVG